MNEDLLKVTAKVAAISKQPSVQGAFRPGPRLFWPDPTDLLVQLDLRMGLYQMLDPLCNKQQVCNFLLDSFD